MTRCFGISTASRKLADLVAAQHRRQALRLAAGRDDLFNAPVALERDLIEEADGGDRHQDRAGGQLPVLDQMDLIGSDVSRPQQLGGLAEMAGELGDLLDVGALGVQREVADLHVLDHAMAKRRHGRLLCGTGRARGRDPSSRRPSRQKNRMNSGTTIVPVVHGNSSRCLR
jgi:hypothetical protein